LEEARMDQARAQALLTGERIRLERLLAARSDTPDPVELGDEVDDAVRRDAAETSMSVDQLLRARWGGVERAEGRLAAGRYGRSVRSGRAIADERLEADPLAELTVEEAAAQERGAAVASEDAFGVPSARYPFGVLDDAGITPEEEQAAEEANDEPASAQSPGIRVEFEDRLR
jgi:DnaK suppressor protein